MEKVAKRPIRFAIVAFALAGVLALGAVAAFVAMVWSVFQLLMLPF